MVEIALEHEVKEAFSNVKDDILALKRSINRDLLAIEEVAGRLGDFIPKAEFYSFIKRLGERLESMEVAIERFSSYDAEIRDIEAKVRNASKKLSRQEDLTSEVREIRKVAGRLNALEGSAVDAKKFNREVAGLSSELGALRKAMLTAKSLDDIKSGVSRVAKRLEALEAASPSRDDVGAVSSAVDELKASLGPMEERNAAIIDGAVSSLRKDIDRRVSDVRKELSALQGVVERSVSEVDLGDYVLRKDLNSVLSQVNALSMQQNKMSLAMSDSEGSLKSLAKASASADELRQLSSDVRAAARQIESLKDSFERRTEQLSARFEKDVARIKAEERPKRPRGGILAGIVRAVSNFFREDPKNAKPREGFGLFFVALIVLLVVAAGIFAFSSRKPALSTKPNISAIQVSECIDYECTERSAGEYWFDCHTDDAGVCRCFVTNAAGCGLADMKQQKIAAWLPYAMALFFVVALAGFAFFTRRKPGTEKKDGDEVDLDQFFQRK